MVLSYVNAHDQNLYLFLCIPIQDNIFLPLKILFLDNLLLLLRVSFLYIDLFIQGDISVLYTV